MTNKHFALNDTIACGGLHGRLVIGQKLDPPENLDQSLNNLRVTLSLDGEIIEKGQGTNVLDGPISALKYLQEGIAENQVEADLKIWGYSYNWYANRRKTDFCRSDLERRVRRVGNNSFGNQVYHLNPLVFLRCEFE